MPLSPLAAFAVVKMRRISVGLNRGELTARVSFAGVKIFRSPPPSPPATKTPSLPCWKPTLVPSAEKLIWRFSRTPQPDSRAASKMAQQRTRCGRMAYALQTPGLGGGGWDEDA